MGSTDSDSQNVIRALNEIRNNALMLSLANAYFCEEPFLKKIGRAIDSNVEKLKGDIYSLKKSFPGKFVDEIDTDEIIKEIHRTAQSLQNPDQDINERCTVGSLGRELEDQIKSLSNAVNTIRHQVEGGGLTYSKKDSAVGIFVNIKDSLGASFFLGLKIFLCLLVLSIFAFFYLFLTMENKKSLLKEIGKSEAHMKSQQKIVSQLDLENKEFSERIKSLEKGDPSRQERIEIMDLELKIQKNLDERLRVQAKIEIHNKKILENWKKVEGIEKSSFFKRLLRQ